MLKISFEEILEKLDQTLVLCDELGLGQMASRCRFADCRRRIARLIDVVQRRQPPTVLEADRIELQEQQHEYLTALMEGDDCGSILSYLRQCEPT
jgi:hypothetical protein